METIEKTEYKASNIYKTLENDPQYFGGYLNMARLNIYNISNHIAEQFNLPILNEDGEIKNSFLCDKGNKKLNWNYVYSKTRRSLPILRIFDFEELPKSEIEKDPNIINTGKNFAFMADSLKLLFAEIQEFRNDYSHYYSTLNKTKRKITVSEELAVFIRTNFLRAIEYTKDRFKDVLCDDDYTLVANKKLVEQNGTITTEGFVFLISMFLEREHAFQFIGKIKGLKGTQYHSFIATREVLMAFCARLPHDRFVSEDRIQAFSLDLVNTLNRCPKVLYNVITDDEKQKFRPSLEESKKENLLENSSKGRDRDNIEDYIKYIEDLTKKIRHSNRFFYFALKFIDDTNIFSKFRFQVNLGKLLLEQYEKPINDELYQRTIVENAKAFGKLSDFEDEAQVLKQIDKDGNSLGFEQFAPYYNKENNKIGLHTQNDKSIVIYNPKSEFKIKKKLKHPIPTAFLSLHDLPKILMLEYLQKGKSEELINDFILANNSKISNRQFIEEVKNKLPSDWNEFYKRSDSKKAVAYNDKTLSDLKDRKVTLNTILAEHKLNHKQIPSRILDYWLNIVDVNKERAISDRIKLMKKEANDRLKAFQKFKKERKGKIPKIGEMATFLARDIVDLIIDENKKKKITSFYYDKMQECLALFANTEKKLFLIDIINKELQLNETGGHPFLKEINLTNLNNTHDLYEHYLKEKVKKMVQIKDYKTGRNKEIDKSWMTETFYRKEWNEKVGKKLTVVKLPDDMSDIPFTIRQLKEKTCYNLDQWLQHITKGKTTNGKRPIDIPTNLFDETLISLFKNELNNQNVDYSEDAKYNELFKIWWKNRDDSTQNFYKAEREYIIYDQKVNFKLQENAKFIDLYKESLKRAFLIKKDKRKIEKRTDRRLPDIQFSQVEKVFKRTISNTEKEIRFTQEEDRIMLLMLEKLMPSENNLEIKLNNIDTILNKTIPIKQSVKGELSFNDNGEYYKQGENKTEISKTISDERKRKDYSMLNKFVFDRRLPELFEYFTDDEIPLQNLKNELDAYNNAKHKVLDMAFKLEEKIISNPAYEKEVINLIDKDFKGHNIQHKPYLLWLKKEGKIDEDELLFLNMVRNCFSHNQFPRKKTMELHIKQFETDKFALQIAKVYDEKIDSLLAEL